MALGLIALPCTSSQVRRLYNMPFSVEAKRPLLRIQEAQRSEANVRTCCPLGLAQETPSSRTFPREVQSKDKENLVIQLIERGGAAKYV